MGGPVSVDLEGLMLVENDVIIVKFGLKSLDNGLMVDYNGKC